VEVEDVVEIDEVTADDGLFDFFAEESPFDFKAEDLGEEGLGREI
jgi:hypothetical protein